VRGDFSFTDLEQFFKDFYREILTNFELKVITQFFRLKFQEELNMFQFE